jgi:hypothetical protein
MRQMRKTKKEDGNAKSEEKSSQEKEEVEPGWQKSTNS